MTVSQEEEPDKGIGIVDSALDCELDPEKKESFPQQ